MFVLSETVYKIKTIFKTYYFVIPFKLYFSENFKFEYYIDSKIK
jgi:hypothetical protein